MQGMGWVFRRNELTGVIECWQCGEEKEYAATLVSHLADEIWRLYGWQPRAHVVRQALEALAEHCAYNPLQEMLAGLPA